MKWGYDALCAVVCVVLCCCVSVRAGFNELVRFVCDVLCGVV